MKTVSSAPLTIAETRSSAGRWIACVYLICLTAAYLVPGYSATAVAAETGRLFYTPAQRAMLEQARARKITSLRATPAESIEAAPQRYDGLVIRSDGQTTRWVNGRAQLGTPGLGNLKPGQIRAHGRVYEPYQVLRTPPETTP
ncbi:MAG: hypothetical protein ABL877_01000 [Thiobacillus sp.]